MDTSVDPRGVQEDAVQTVGRVVTEGDSGGGTDVESVYEHGSEEDNFSDLVSDNEQLVGSVYVVDQDIETDDDDDDALCDTVLLDNYSHTVAAIGTELQQKSDFRIQNPDCKIMKR